MDAFARRPVPVDGAPDGATNAYRIGRERALVVDPAGPLGAADAGGIAHVALTHHHRDHVGEVAPLADAGATLWARAGRAGKFETATGRRPDRSLDGGTAIPTDAGPVTALELPGHTPEHVGFVLPPGLATGDGDGPKGGGGDSGRAMLVGDLAVAEGSVAVAAPEGDLRSYLTSLRRVRVRKPARLYPGHGPPIDDPSAATARLLARRRTRQRRVLKAVRSGARTVPGITDAAYGKELTGVRALAEGTVRAHLEKLAVEGRVVLDRGDDGITVGRARPRG